MLIGDSLTQMERAGAVVTFTDPSPRERDAIAIQFAALKATGHAVVGDETISHEEAPIVRVFHYKTCSVCINDALRRNLGKVHTSKA